MSIGVKKIHLRILMGSVLLNDMQAGPEHFLPPIPFPIWKKYIWNDEGVSNLSYDRFCSQFTSVLGPIQLKHYVYLKRSAMFWSDLLYS